MSSQKLTPRAQGIYDRSVVEFKKQDKEGKQKRIDHIKAQLKVHKSGAKNIGFGFDSDTVSAGKKFLADYDKPKTKTMKKQKFKRGDEGMLKGQEVKINEYRDGTVIYNDIKKTKTGTPTLKPLSVGFQTISEFEKSFSKFPTKMLKTNPPEWRKDSVVKKELSLMQKLKKTFSQSGSTTKKADSKRIAKKAGWRVSKSGNVYFENRANRSDKRKFL